MTSVIVSRRGFMTGAAGVTGAIAFGVASPSASALVPSAAVRADNVRVMNEIVLQLVSTAENSTKNWRSAYGYIQDIGDGRGYTAGIVGWCSGTGDMLELVNYYARATPGNPLQRYIPALRRVMSAPYNSRPALSHSLLGGGFTRAWAAAAKTAGFQAAQRRERDRVYWTPARVAANTDRVSFLGMYLYYDISVNHGPGNDRESFGGILAGVRRTHRTPARGGNELAYLTALINARDAVLKGWGGYQSNGRSSIGRKLVRDRNLALRLPLTWSVYGDAFSITGPPTP